MRYILETVKISIQSILGIWFGIPLMFLAPFAKLKRMKRAGIFVSRQFALAFAWIFSKFSGYYCLIEFLPKRADDVTACNLITDTKENECAIVLQGPASRFTAETVRTYRKIFPRAYIIASTWEGTDAGLADELRSVADDVILSRLPASGGVRNINYQAKSSHAGVKRAYELGIRYVMKTRSDQRIYNPVLFEYMKSLLEIFPLDRKYSQWQKERIIALPGGGVADRYYISDYFYFGDSQDLMKFFDFPPDMTDYRNAGNDPLPMAEVELMKSYLARNGSGMTRATVEGFWENVKGRFLIISRSDLRLYREKYYRTRVNFWGIAGDVNRAEPISDEDRKFTTQISLSLLRGHLFYDKKFEEYRQ